MEIVPSFLPPLLLLNFRPQHLLPGKLQLGSLSSSPESKSDNFQISANGDRELITFPVLSRLPAAKKHLRVSSSVSTLSPAPLSPYVLSHKHFQLFLSWHTYVHFVPPWLCTCYSRNLDISFLSLTNSYSVLNKESVISPLLSQQTSHFLQSAPQHLLIISIYGSEKKKDLILLTLPSSSLQVLY